MKIVCNLNNKIAAGHATVLLLICILFSRFCYKPTKLVLALAECQNVVSRSQEPNMCGTQYFVAIHIHHNIIDSLEATS